MPNRGMALTQPQELVAFDPVVTVALPSLNEEMLRPPGQARFDVKNFCIILGRHSFDLS